MKMLPGRSLAVLATLLVLGACRDREPLRPDPDSGLPSAAFPSLKAAASGALPVGWVALPPAASSAWEIGGVGDVSSDGKADIVWQNRTTRETGFWKMSGTTVVAWVPLPSAASGDWQIGGVGKLRVGDTAYVVWQNRATRETGVWKITTDTVRAWVPLSLATSSDWEIGGVGDLGGDDRLDVVWQNRATRETSVWEIDGATVTARTALPPAASSDWQIGAVADMNGDRKSDIVWQNRATRETGFWVMDGTTVTTWVPMAPAQSGDWQISGAADMAGDRETDLAWQNRVTRDVAVWDRSAPAVALSDGRVRIHPDVVLASGFDAGQPLWLAWVGNRFLKPFELETSYRGLTPGQLQRVQRISGGAYDGWYETRTPVVGGCFTVVQLSGGVRRFADLTSWGGWTGLYPYEGRRVMRLNDDGHAAARLDSWIRVYRQGDRTYLRLSRDVLPVDDVSAAWRLVGSSDWTYGGGRPIASQDAGGITFDVSGRRRYANALARSTLNTDVWGLFGHLGDRSIDLSGAACESRSLTGYKHPDVRVSGSEAGVWLEPDMPTTLPHLFVNGSEEQVWWPNPSQPPAGVVGEFKAATAWFGMVDDMRAPEPSTVEVDYLRMYARVNGTDQLVSENHYHDGRFGGGLYSRTPWFTEHKAELSGQVRVEGGSLVLPLSNYPEWVWHLWMDDSWRDASGQTHWRKPLPAGTTRVWVEARVRIRGPAALQLGFDYNRTTQDTTCDKDQDGDEDPGGCEAGKTRWAIEVFDNDGWQVLTLGR